MNRKKKHNIKGIKMVLFFCFIFVMGLSVCGQNSDSSITFISKEIIEYDTVFIYPVHFEIGVLTHFELSKPQYEFAENMGENLIEKQGVKAKIAFGNGLYLQMRYRSFVFQTGVLFSQLNIGHRAYSGTAFKFVENIILDNNGDTISYHITDTIKALQYYDSKYLVGADYDFVKTRSLDTVSKISSIQIPMLIGYRFKFDKWALLVKGGVEIEKINKVKSIPFNTKQNGELLVFNSNNVEQLYRTKYLAYVELEKEVKDNWFLRTSWSIRYRTGESVDQLINQKQWVTGLQIALGYKLR